MYIGNYYARCTICGIDFGISHGGKNDVSRHVRVKRHVEMAKLQHPHPDHLFSAQI